MPLKKEASAEAGDPDAPEDLEDLEEEPAGEASAASEEELEQVPSAEDEEPEGRPAEAATPASLDPLDDDLDDDDDEDETGEPEREKDEAPEADAGVDSDDEVDAELAGEDAEEAPVTDESPAQESRPSEERASRFSRTDLIWLGALGFVLLAIGLFALAEFGRNINTDRPADQVEFPFEAGNVKIGKISTFWRTPDRSTDQGVRLDAKLIPCATIKLQSGSGSGALRFFFEGTGR